MAKQWIKDWLKFKKMYWQISRSNLFDREFYLRYNLDVARSCMNPVKHYILHGWREGRNPNYLFDTSSYLRNCPELKSKNINPLYHYIKYGRYETRFNELNITQERVKNLIKTRKQNSAEDNLSSFVYRKSEEELLSMVRQYNEQKSSRKAKVVVYTAIIGNYDPLILPETIVNDWDYVCFSDTDIPGEHIFEIRQPDYFNIDPTRTSRFLKTHPHYYFPEYDYSIWIDSNILIRGPHIEQSVSDCAKRGVLFMCNPHPVRTCVYDELLECITLNKDDRAVMEQQIARYRSEGYPDGNDMLETNIMIRKHNDAEIKKLDNLWWAEICMGSRRDQLSIMYAIWKQKLQYEKLKNIGSIRRHEDENYWLFQHGGKHKLISYRQPSFMKSDCTAKRIISSELPDINSLKNNRIDIIICVHNALNDVIECINSVIENLLPSHKIIIIDDYSDDDVNKYLQDIHLKKPEQIILIRNEESLGYTKSANIGMKISDAPFVILLNSDTIVSKNWAVKLLQTSLMSPDIAVVGPLSNAASWQSVPHIYQEGSSAFAVNQLPENITVEDINYLCEQLAQSVKIPLVSLINGFCYGIKRDVLNKIGFFDESAFPRGYGEEDDFSMRAANSAYIHAIAIHCYVYHKKTKSFKNSERQALAISGRSVLAKRYTETRIRRDTQSMLNNPTLKLIRQKISELYKNKFASTVNSFEKNLSINSDNNYALLAKKAPEIFPRELMLADITANEIKENDAFVINMDKTILDIPKTVNWFLPNFQNILRGGIRTIFMVAEDFSKNWGTTNHFIICETSNSIAPDVLKIKSIFPSLKYSLLQIFDREEEINIPKSDIAFCTSWPTAYALARFNRCKAKFYFMQDYESMFYPAGSVQGIIDETYKMGFYCIANTKGIADKYKLFSQQVDYFIPGIDKKIYYPSPNHKLGPPYKIIFYGRPNNKRNAFALGIDALKKIKNHFGNAAQIFSAGSEWNPSDYGLENIINNLGELKKIEDVAQLYRESHAGLIFMFTPHPSYQPFEYMACGCPTVTNKNSDNAWLIKERQNAIITSALPEDIANGTINLLENKELWTHIVEGGLKTVQNLNWESSFAKIRDFVLNPKRDILYGNN